MADFEQERTEKATPKKRLQERKKGNVARSQDLVAALALVVAAIVLLSTARSNATSAMTYMRSCFAEGFVVHADSLTFAAKISELIFLGLKKLALLFLLAVFATLAGNFLQTGFLFLPQKTFPDFTRLNPAKNLRKLFSVTSTIQTGGGCVKTLLFAVIVVASIKRDVQTIVNLPFGAPIEIIAFFVKFITRVASQFCALAVALAVGDYALKRRKYEQRLRMTQQELRDEIKEESGSQPTKGRRREARSAMMNNVAAISSATPTTSVSPFHSKQQEQNAEKNKRARK